MDYIAWKMMEKNSYRTYNPEEANFFFIPQIATALLHWNYHGVLHHVEATEHFVNICNYVTIHILIVQLG